MSISATFVRASFLVVLFALPHSRAAGQQIIYVDDDATGANDGSSWCDAYVYFQDALAASPPPTEIRVAQGVYKPDRGTHQSPGDRSAMFQLQSGVMFRSGFGDCGASNPDRHDHELIQSSLSSDIGFQYQEFDNCYHIVAGTGANHTATLGGLTISDGNANVVPYVKGSGMLNESNPVICESVASGASRNEMLSDFINFRNVIIVALYSPVRPCHKECR